MKFKVGIVGNGNVGSAIERGVKRAGYEVRSAGKEPGAVKELGRWAEVVVLAVPFGAVDDALKELGDVNGKILVDVTNALTPEMKYAASATQSGAEQLQQKAKGAQVVKAFNTVFAQHMDKGQLEGTPLSLFAAGDDSGAKEKVLQLARDIGFDAVDAGPLANARWLEALGFFNIQLGYVQKLGTGIGFKLVHAGAPAAREAGGRTQAERSAPAAH